jgi:hypothetical protein
VVWFNSSFLWFRFSSIRYGYSVENVNWSWTKPDPYIISRIVVWIAEICFAYRLVVSSLDHNPALYLTRSINRFEPIHVDQLITRIASFSSMLLQYELKGYECEIDPIAVCDMRRGRAWLAVDNPSCAWRYCYVSHLFRLYSHISTTSQQGRLIESASWAPIRELLAASDRQPREDHEGRLIELASWAPIREFLSWKLT